MIFGSTVDEFVCRLCGSPAVVYPRVLDDDEPVACAGCAAFVSSFREFKERAERALRASLNGAPITGC